jgi:amphi-Trp domain-containing protein
VGPFGRGSAEFTGETLHLGFMGCLFRLQAAPVLRLAVRMSNPVCGIRMGAIYFCAESEKFMKDLKFEQKRSLSRVEAADQLAALAAALRKGGDAELELSPGTLSLRIPDDLRSEIEVEIGNGEVELEIEFKWPTAATRAVSSRTVADAEKVTRRKNVSAGPGRSSTDAGSKSAKRSAVNTP